MRAVSDTEVFVAEPIDNLEYTLDPLKEVGYTVTLGPSVSQNKQGYTEDQLIEICKHVDAFIGMAREKVTSSVINSAQQLKVICKYGNGVDNIAVEAATKKGILIANAPVHNMTVAEFAFALILSVLKKIPRNMTYLKEGSWRDESTIGNELYKKTVGIVGFGAIGRELANRLRGWETEIIAYDPVVDENIINQYGALAVDWETLFQKSDIVTLHMPLLETTRGIVGKREFDMMKKSAIFINSSRGPIVNEAALIEALKKSEIAAAGMDVFEKEPVLMDNPLRDMENVVLTPHIAGYTEESLLRIAVQTTDNCMKALNGNLPDYIVNKDAIPLWQERFCR